MSLLLLKNGSWAPFLTSFPLFGQLPVEVRLNIWKHLITASPAKFQEPLTPGPRGGFTDEGEDPLAYRLKKVPVGHGLIGMFTHWQAMEEAFGVSRGHLGEAGGGGITP
ncbi:hypothetical protein PspLS_01716 [Pyricularia sp. CBS 133598]|nr:hypothetical protein PspLS_01716 [Pyricularia sp. CBS 133598]